MGNLNARNFFLSILWATRQIVLSTVERGFGTFPRMPSSESLSQPDVPEGTQDQLQTRSIRGQAYSLLFMACFFNSLPKARRSLPARLAAHVTLPFASAISLVR